MNFIVGLAYPKITSEIRDLGIVRNEESRCMEIAPCMTWEVTMPKWHWQVYDWLISETNTPPEFVFKVKEIVDQDGLTRGFGFDQHVMWFLECYYERYQHYCDGSGDDTQSD